MNGSKYLSEAVHETAIKRGALNIVQAPVGSGKTHWACNYLFQHTNSPYRRLFLTDTIIAKQQLQRHKKIHYYSNSWLDEVQFQRDWFGENLHEKEIVGITYAKFGKLVLEHPTFAEHLDVIVCDEIHDLIYFKNIKNKDGGVNYAEIAKEQLETLCQKDTTTIIGISATPQLAVEKMACPTAIIPVDDDVHQYDVRETVYFDSIGALLNNLPKEQTGILYTTQISQMKQLQEQAKSLGFRPICIWGSSQPMDEEQLAARQSIIDEEKIPPEYNLLIINAACGTSINIKSPVDYIAVNNRCQDIQTQVRGRFRGDLATLYLPRDNTKPEQGPTLPILVPPQFLNRKLFKKDKDTLCQCLMLKGAGSGYLKWNGVRPLLEQAGYHITDGRGTGKDKNRRYVIISI